LSPGAAYEATAHGAILVDIRPAAQRAHEGHPRVASDRTKRARMATRPGLQRQTSICH
jgi:hypothetical protein